MNIPILRLIRSNETPPGGFQYVQPETGIKFEHYVFDVLKDNIKQHRKANSIPIGLNFDQDVEQQNAERLLPIAPEWVESDEPHNPFMLAARFAHAALTWARSGFKVVTEAQLTQRQSICLACKHWNGSKMFGYGACDVCGCSGLKLFAATEKCPIGLWNTL